MFVVGFEDGVVAVYDATRASRDADLRGRRPRTVGSGNGEEVAHVDFKRFSGVSFKDGVPLVRADRNTSGVAEAGSDSSFLKQSPRIVDAKFMPHRKAQVVLVDNRGRCIVVDFDKPDKKRGRVLRTWHVRAPATSLSVLCPGEKGQNDRVESLSKSRMKSTLDGSTDGLDSTSPSDDILTAVGRVDGKVLLFDSEGTLRAQKTFDVEGGRIIDVEWVAGPTHTRSVRSRSRLESRSLSTLQSATPEPKRRRESIRHSHQRRNGDDTNMERKSVGSILAAGREEEEEVTLLADDTTLPLEPSRSTERTKQADAPTKDRIQPAIWQDMIGAEESNFMTLFSPVKGAGRKASLISPASKALGLAAAVETNPPLSGMPSAISSPQLWDERVNSRRLSVSRRVSKKGRRVSVRKAPIPPRQIMSTNTKGVVPKKIVPITDEVAAPARSRQGMGSNGLAFFAPYMDSKIIKGGMSSRELTPLNASEVNKANGSKGSEDGDVWMEQEEENPNMGVAEKAQPEGRPERINTKEGSKTPKDTTRKTRPRHSGDDPKFPSMHIDSSAQPRQTENLTSPPIDPPSIPTSSRFSSSDPASIHQAPEVEELNPTEYVTRAYFEEEMKKLRNLLQADMKNLQTEMLSHFQEQRRLFEEALRRRSQAR